MAENRTKDLEVVEKKPIAASEGEPTREGVIWVPQVDILEDAEAVTLRVDLPGVRRENVSVDVREGVLTLTATVEPANRSWRSVYSEYEVGGYARKFALGDRVDQDKISAQMDHGVLTLAFPKAERHKPRRIEIR